LTGIAKPFREFVLDPVVNASPALFMLRVSQLLHERTGGRLDSRLQRLLGKPRASLPPASLMDDGAIDRSVEALHRRGWDVLPWRVDQAGIDMLRSFAFSTPAYATDPHERVVIDAANPPRDHARYVWPITDLIRVPAVQKLMTDSTLYKLAQNYLGYRPVLTSVTLWIDPVYDGSYNAHRYHYDNDGPGFLKFFIYVSDVDLESGAHSYIEGSHHHRKPERFRRSQFYSRDDLVDFYGKQSEIIFSAPAGTVIAEDTAGFHKGTTPRNSYRLLLQFQFAVIDIPHVEEFSSSIEKIKIERLDPSIKLIARKFVA